MRPAFLSTIHTHTTFCDGKATAADMAKTAKDLGFVSYGFSAHAPLPYENDWAMREEDIPLYIRTIRELKAQYENQMEIYLGIELDADSRIDCTPYEYVIGSLHTLHKDGMSFPVDCDRGLLVRCRDELFGGDFMALMRYYYESLYHFVQNSRFDVLGHFDLPLKYNKNGIFLDETDPKYQKMSLEMLDAIIDCRSDLIFEINTGGILRASRPYAYPAPVLLSRLAERGVRMTMTSDAHRPEGIDASYDTTCRQLTELGIHTLWRLQGGKFTEVPHSLPN